MKDQTIDAAALHADLCSGAEIALIDLRETGSFGQRHILRAVNIPRSRLELSYRRMIPRCGVPIVLCDAGEGLTDCVVDILTFAGWRNVRVLKGGIDAWEAAGYPLFSGVNVPSKAFGEFIEARDGTPHVSADALHEMQARGDNIAVLDSRPFPEFHKMSIPGGIDMPGAELVHRVKTVVTDPATKVVVNCAGRTRSIIGAQSLINAGLENEVVALENGTMGWMLAGYDCANDSMAVAALPGQADGRWGRDAAEKVARRFGVGRVLWRDVESWRADPDRTTYLLDVRSREEFLAGHIPGSQHAPGGQLVQATDEYVGVQNARLVLIDDAGTRALMTGSWLRQMGWRDVAVLESDLSDIGLERGEPPCDTYELALMSVAKISVPDFMKMGPGVPLVDFSRSLDHRKGHPKGARFAIRSRLMRDLSPILSERWMVFTADDPRIACLAAQDMTRGGVHRVKVLDGGNAEWRILGGEIETGMTDPFSLEEDVFHKPYDLTLNRAAMQQYIDWETALMPLVERDGTLTFPSFPD